MPTFYKRKEGSGRKRYDDLSMEQAILHVRSGDMKFREAARNYCVPYSTLVAKVKSPNKAKNPGMGPASCLGSENETILANRIKELSEAGFPINSRKVRELAYEFATQLGIPHRFNNKKKAAGYPWFKSFMRRNKTLAIRKSTGLSLARAKGCSRKAVNKFFDKLEEVLDKHQLRDKPERIYNCDESGIQMINSTGKVVCVKGAKAVHKVTTGERGETATILACYCAEGTYLPPIMIYKGARYKHEYADGLPRNGQVYLNKQSAYINADLFVKWFKEVFLPRKPLGHSILIFDGHSSHCSSLEVMDLANENNVTLLCLPPHTTHVLQPLDRTFFSSFKEALEDATDSWVVNHPGRKVTKYQLGSLVREAWFKAATTGNAVSGFEVTGIYPCNRHRIPERCFRIADLMEEEKEKSADIETDENLQILEQEVHAIDLEDTEESGESGEEADKDKNDQNPTEILENIFPTPILPKGNTSTRRRPVSSPVIELTSKEYCEKLRLKKEAQALKEAQLAAKAAKLRKIKKERLSTSMDERVLIKEEPEEELRGKKKATKKSGARKKESHDERVLIKEEPEEELRGKKRATKKSGARKKERDLDGSSGTTEDLTATAPKKRKLK